MTTVGARTGVSASGLGGPTRRQSTQNNILKGSFFFFFLMWSDEAFEGGPLKKDVWPCLIIVLTECFCLFVCLFFVQQQQN